MTDQFPELPYIQIAEGIREQIETGQLKPGDKLPSNRTLMEKYGAGTQTVQRAVRTLKEAGLVETRASRGVYVKAQRKKVERSADFTNAPKGGNIDYGVKTKRLSVGEVPAPQYVAEEFGFDVDTPVVRRARLMLMPISEEPVELVTSYYPMDVAAGTELARDRGLRGGSPAALERIGLEVVRSRELVYTRLPLPSEIQHLNLNPGHPVFRILRTLFVADGRPVEVMEMVRSGDGYVLRYDL